MKEMQNWVKRSQELVTWPTLEILGPLHISGRLKLETLNLASRLITMGTNERKAKLGQKGPGRVHVTYFRNFGTPSISREWLELETPNFSCRFITRGTKERNAKLGQRGSERGHVTYFWNFWTPSISREWVELETPNFACRLQIHHQVY